MQEIFETDIFKQSLSIFKDHVENVFFSNYNPMYNIANKIYTNKYNSVCKV